jgi:predicted kinase
MKSLQLAKPHMLVVVGLPGSGKTFFAAQFSDTFNAPYVDYGQYRRVCGNFKVGTQLASHTLSQLLRTKQTVIVEGRGATRADRRDIVKAAHKYGYDVLYIWIQTDPEASELRATRSKTAAITLEEFDRQSREFESLAKNEKYVVISGKHTHASQAKVVLKKLVVPRQITVSESIRQMPRRNNTVG